MSALDQTTLSLVSAFAGLIGAVGGLFAAVAAFRSAGTAKEAAKHAQQVEHRELVRDLVAILQSIVAETMRVDDLANKLKTSYESLEIIHGESGKDRARVLIGALKRKQSGIGDFQQNARNYLEGVKSLRSTPEEELTSLVLKHDGYLIQIRRVKEKFEEDLVSFASSYLSGDSIGVPTT